MRPPSAIALDTSCVINLLQPGEQPQQALLSLIALGLQSRVIITVTELVEDELPKEIVGTDGRVQESYVRDRMRMFAGPIIDANSVQSRDARAQEYMALLWPKANSSTRNYGHSLRDCLHMASHELRGGSVFVTTDSKLHRKAQRSRAKMGISVLTPEECLSLFKPAVQVTEIPDYIVRPATEADAPAIVTLLQPVKELYPNFEAWLDSALNKKRSFVGIIEDAVAGIAVWANKDDRVVKLSTFFVGDDHRGRGLGPYLLFHQLRTWVANKVEKVIVTVSSARLNVLPFFLAYGFRVEGTSARRYASDMTEFVLAKHFYYQRVTELSYNQFIEQLAAELFSIPSAIRGSHDWFNAPYPQSLVSTETAGVYGATVVAGDTPLHSLSLATLEDITYPARFAFSTRRAFMIPIRPVWADRMIHISRSQGSLFEPQDAVDRLRLRTDNAYYLTPRFQEEELIGAASTFYVSSPDSMLAGCCRILDCVVATPEELFLRFGDLGIYSVDNIRQHLNSKGKAMALRFGWWVPFQVPIPLNRMRAELKLAHPQAITAISYAKFEEILELGGVTW